MADLLRCHLRMQVADLALSATSGKIALVSNSTVLTGTSPSGSQIIDFIGYGEANASENQPAPALTNTTAAVRRSGGCVDTNNNQADFTTGQPSSRNSRSPFAPALSLRHRRSRRRE